MREVTQKKFDKAQKLVKKGYNPTTACKEVGLNYMRYKELAFIENIPKSEYIVKEKDNEISTYEDKSNVIDNLLEIQIRNIANENDKLKKENFELKQFIKKFL